MALREGGPGFNWGRLRLPLHYQAFFLWCFDHGSYWGDRSNDPCEVCIAVKEGRVIEPVPRLLHPVSVRFHEIINELQALHDRKQMDYGRVDDPFANVRASADFGVKPWVGAMIRLNDKVKRLQRAAQGGTLANEGVIDSLDDIAVYAIIARILYEEEHDSHI